MKKTILEYLNTINDEKIRKSAVKQCISPKIEVYSLKEAVLKAFTWWKTYEDSKFWEQFYDSIDESNVQFFESPPDSVNGSENVKNSEDRH